MLCPGSRNAPLAFALQQADAAGRRCRRRGRRRKFPAVRWRRRHRRHAVRRDCGRRRWRRAVVRWRQRWLRRHRP
ncbi:hypothetical protein CH263_01945 [Rhodococcus sp. 06-1059B-a]|nr:hypothetical protein CH263_01945 [Rhodococcus sp. 06-1059B-a]